MATLDPTRFDRFNKLFPVFTPIQSQYAFLYAQGLSCSQISSLTGVSQQTIDKHLRIAAKKLNIASLSIFRNAIHFELSLRILDKIS